MTSCIRCSCGNFVAMKLQLLIALLVICTHLQAQTKLSYALDRNLDSATYPHTISVKTDALAYGLLIFNVAAEIDIAPCWTFNLPIHYSGLNYFRSTTKFRVFSVQPEVRYWTPGVKGLFYGTHLGLTYYNIAANGTYRYQDTQRRRPALGGGVAIGYRVAFKHNPRWFVEFSAGLGVYDVHYEKFINEQNGRQASSDIHATYFGPDQLRVSFGYSFDWHKPKNHEK